MCKRRNTGKARLEKYNNLAMRARSAFKLIQMNRKNIENTYILIDL